jgi:hypothetical protein
VRVANESPVSAESICMAAAAEGAVDAGETMVGCAQGVEN